MSEPFAGYLLAYFANGLDEDSEQIRFAVTPGIEPTDWVALAGGKPILRSTVGEQGVRDPFLIRDPDRHRFLVIATDLRTWPDADWDRAVRWGSQSIVIWESVDLIRWSEPRRVEVGPPDAGNVWAPKAYPRQDGSWILFFASALYPPGSSREASSYQRMMFTTTGDFRSFAPAEVYLDRGHDVIDATFVSAGERILRFSADSRSAAPDKRSQFVLQEIGDSCFDPAFRPVVQRIGEGVLKRGEGPAAFVGIDGRAHYLLIDEFGLRGYQLFRSQTPENGEWQHLAEAALPEGARHGSVIPVTARDRERLLAAHAHP